MEQAREYRGLTQIELSSRIGVEQSAVSMIERGLFQPSESLLGEIANQLDFPFGFFEREPLHDFSLGTLDFRARSDTTAKSKRRAYQYARLVFEVAANLCRNLKIPQPRLQKLVGDPEEAARLCRSEIGLSPDKPIVNLTDSLERAGVFVFAMPDLFAGCDGFSAWGLIDHRLIPAIFVSSSAPGDRARLTLAHELGELTLLDKPPGRQRERLANRFAGALLMPEESFRGNLVPPVSIDDLVELKRIYGVSIQASLVRAYQLEIISDRRYRALYKQISIEGWRTNEPITVSFEKPRVLSRMAEILYGEKIDLVRLGADMALKPIFLKGLLSAQATQGDLRGKTRAKSADVITFPDSNKNRAAGTAETSDADEA